MATQKVIKYRRTDEYRSPQKGEYYEDIYGYVQLAKENLGFPRFILERIEE